MQIEALFLSLFLLDPITLIIGSVLVFFSCLSWCFFIKYLFCLLQWKMCKYKLTHFWSAEFQLTLQHSILAGDDKAFSWLFNWSLSPIMPVLKTGLHVKKNFLKKTTNCELDFNTYLSSQLVMAKNHQSYSKSLSWLANIASSSPFLGLLGTVWGLSLALRNMEGESQAQLNVLAPIVGETLVITGLGLAVAIPAQFIYNLVNQFTQQRKSEYSYFTQQWHNYLVTGISPVQLVDEN